MPISRYAKVLLQTPGTGSLLICLIGLLLGAALIAKWGHSANSLSPAYSRNQVRPASLSDVPSRATGNAPVAPSATRVSKVEPHAATVKIMPTRTVQKGSVQQSNVPDRLASSLSGRRSEPHLKGAIFKESISNKQLEVLNDYAGRPAKEALRQSKVREVMNTLVPYVPFHFGLDMPLPTAIEAILLRSSLPIGIRDGRYMMLATDASSGSTRAFFWIDMQEGIAVGGIFFHPNNGEPTPTLTLFSKQVEGDSLKMSQLPLAFAQDLSRWAAGAGVPPVTTRYFINASGEKIVLKHDEDFCKPSSVTADSCSQLKDEAANLDLQATYFLRKTNYAANATLRMIDSR